MDPDPSNDDPKEDATLNANLYLYTNNNPVTNTDPTGTGFWSKVKNAVKRYAKVQAAINSIFAPIQAAKIVKNDFRAMTNRKTSWGQRGWIAFGYVPGVGRVGQGARYASRVARGIKSVRNWQRAHIQFHTAKVRVKYGQNRGTHVRALHLNVRTRKYNYHVYPNPRHWGKVTKKRWYPISRSRRR